MFDPDAFEVLCAKSIADPVSGCWNWSSKQKRYGRMRWRGDLWSAHRLMLSITEPVPDGRMYACHSCDNPKCVNPKHLFWGTNSDNMKDCVAKKRHPESKKTHCPRGHEYSGHNMLLRPNGNRKCRECNRIRSLNRYWRSRDGHTSQSSTQ
jgi:hypothetical protein